MSTSENTTTPYTARRIHADIIEAGVPEFVFMMKGFRFRRPEDLLAEVNERFIQDIIELDERIFGDGCLKYAFFCLDTPLEDIAKKALRQVEYGALRLVMFSQGLRFLGELHESKEQFAGLDATELLGIVTMLLLDGDSETDLADDACVVVDNELATVYDRGRAPRFSLPLAAVEQLSVEEFLS